MTRYAGIDWHANNRVVVIRNEQDPVRYQPRLAHHLPTLLEPLAPSHAEIKGVGVESTYNGYGLVEGWMDADYRVPLANIDPKAERAVRDVWRKRAHLVRHPPSQVLRVPNILARHTGLRFRVKPIHHLSPHDLEKLLPEAEQVLAVTRSWAILTGLKPPITPLEKAVSQRLKPTPADEQLLSVNGIGEMLAQTIVLETGEMGRLATGGNEASYGRGVRSTQISNGKRNGQGHVKNGNPYLEWADREAAPFAIRLSPKIQRFYQRKAAKSQVLVARKSVAHQRARAGFDVMRDGVPFEVDKAFGWGSATPWGEVRDGSEKGLATRRWIRPGLTPWQMASPRLVASGDASTVSPRKIGPPREPWHWWEGHDWTR